MFWSRKIDLLEYRGSKNETATVTVVRSEEKNISTKCNTIPEIQLVQPES